MKKVVFTSILPLSWEIMRATLYIATLSFDGLLTHVMICAQTATGRIRNTFGGAETLEANLSLGTKTRKSFRVSLAAPLTPDLQTHAELMAFGLEKDCTAFASCMEGIRGVKAVVRVS